MIAVVIIAMLSGAIAIAVIKQQEKARLSAAATEARTIRTAAQLWRADARDVACPTLDDLLKEELLERGTRKVDPWGSGYRIDCVGNQIVVASAGPDRKRGTADDVRVPNDEQSSVDPAAPP